MIKELEDQIGKKQQELEELKAKPEPHPPQIDTSDDEKAALL